MKRKKRQKPPKRRKVEIDIQQLDQIVDKACESPLTRDEGDLLKSSIHAMAERLMRQFRTTEKANALLGADDGSDERGAEDDAGEDNGTDGSNDAPPTAEKKRRPGHGRNGVAKYPGAEFINVAHPDLMPQCACPGCLKGRLFDPKRPKIILRIKGLGPIAATVYNLQQLRCNLCGGLYPAPAPPGVGDKKFDETVASMIAQLKYGMGMPFNRIQALQMHLGVPLPAGTQWGLVAAAAAQLKPVHEELQRLAASAEVQHTDDTRVRILEAVERPEDHDEDRTGVHTTGIVARLGERTIALFTSGPNHAGENLRDLLAMRPTDLPPPLVMSDALSHNASKLPPEFEEVLGNCLTHGRRQFVDILESFPEQCRHVIEQIGQVYGFDAQAREQGLDAQARLSFHQAHSGPVMEAFKKWMEAQLKDRKAEPNSGLGKAIRYFLKRWDRFTLFLRREGAPLDNNVVERALKKAVLHRKSALFYKNQNGAGTGDLYMSLIHTCELNKINSFKYLTELQRHAQEVEADPALWLPWNYHLQLVRPPNVAAAVDDS